MLLTNNGFEFMPQVFLFCHNCLCYCVVIKGGGCTRLDYFSILAFKNNCVVFNGGVAYDWTIFLFLLLKNNCVCYCVVFNGGLQTLGLFLYFWF